LIDEGDWSSDRLPTLKRKLLKKLNIKEQDTLEQDILFKQKLDDLKGDLEKLMKQQLEDIRKTDIQ